MGEAGSAGAALEWMAAGGCGLSGDLLAVRWSLFDEAPLRLRSNLENTQWVVALRLTSLSDLRLTD